jgi:hypothetical protein
LKSLTKKIPQKMASGDFIPELVGTCQDVERARAIGLAASHVVILGLVPRICRA